MGSCRRFSRKTLRLDNKSRLRDAKASERGTGLRDGDTRVNGIAGA
jgi:hypothetical protein